MQKVDSISEEIIYLYVIYEWIPQEKSKNNTH